VPFYSLCLLFAPQTMFEKLMQYIGRNVKQLVERPDERYCFRLHRDRVYYVRYISSYPQLLC
jgi:hypothetical protein